jgi:hypothetical protein
MPLIFAEAVLICVIWGTLALSQFPADAADFRRSDSYLRDLRDLRETSCPNFPQIPLISQKLFLSARSA